MVSRIPITGARKLNLGSGMDVRPASEGWTNMDGYVDHPDVLKHDIVDLPYPFPDDAFDTVYASHVVEHIPVVFREWKGTQRDVLYAVMEELHRILKPGGRLHILVPLGGTDMGWVNPQHYRQWRPEHFSYFEPKSAEAVYHAAHFRRERLEFNKSGIRARYFLPLGESRLGVFEHLLVRFPWLSPVLEARHEMEAVLVAVK